MPITAKLSKAFYERLGEQVTNELVELLNLIDGNYRSELRGINEMNFARFDAATLQRFAETEAKFDKRFASMEVRFEQRVGELRAEIATMHVGIVTQLTRVMTERFEAQGRLILLSWVTLLGTILALRLA